MGQLVKDIFLNYVLERLRFLKNIKKKTFDMIKEENVLTKSIDDFLDQKDKRRPIFEEIKNFVVEPLTPPTPGVPLVVELGKPKPKKSRVRDNKGRFIKV